MTLADRIAVMKGGSIQQLDAPLTIYSKPINRYVAGFIGSPSMNFIKAKIGGTAKAPTVEVAAQTLNIAEYSFVDSPTIGRDIEFGARPEHINILRAKDMKVKNVFSATVELVEPMGSDSLVWLELGNQKLSARVESSEHFKSGEKVGVQFRVDQSSLFDLASGDRL